ncbi:hypothetical protein R1sor_007856 [Riccia sorocarpa]|uniref:Uncharacterized protein n=1 Tax=Riccia sorocarpa TaxID=122646 RepID=A0ABD3HVT6_9MARC
MASSISAGTSGGIGAVGDAGTATGGGGGGATSATGMAGIATGASAAVAVEVEMAFTTGDLLKSLSLLLEEQRRQSEEQLRKELEHKRIAEVLKTIRARYGWFEGWYVNRYVAQYSSTIREFNVSESEVVDSFESLAESHIWEEVHNLKLEYGSSWRSFKQALKRRFWQNDLDGEMEEDVDEDPTAVVVVPIVNEYIFVDVASGVAHISDDITVVASTEFCGAEDETVPTCLTDGDNSAIDSAASSILTNLADGVDTDSTIRSEDGSIVVPEETMTVVSYIEEISVIVSAVAAPSVGDVGGSATRVPTEGTTADPTLGVPAEGTTVDLVPTEGATVDSTLSVPVEGTTADCDTSVPTEGTISTHVGGTFVEGVLAAAMDLPTEARSLGDWDFQISLLAVDVLLEVLKFYQVLLFFFKLLQLAATTSFQTGGGDTIIQISFLHCHPLLEVLFFIGTADVLHTFSQVGIG